AAGRRASTPATRALRSIRRVARGLEFRSGGRHPAAEKPGRPEKETPMFRAALLCLALLPLPASALDLSAMSDAERDAFRAEVRAYLLEHPEVLEEAITVLG